MTFLNWEKISSNRVEDYTNQLCNRKSSGNPGGITLVFSFFLKGTFHCLICQRHSQQADISNRRIQKRRFYKFYCHTLLAWNKSQSSKKRWNLIPCNQTPCAPGLDQVRWCVWSRPRLILISFFYSAPCLIVNTECVILSDPHVMTGYIFSSNCLPNSVKYSVKYHFALILTSLLLN